LLYLADAFTNETDDGRHPTGSYPARQDMAIEEHRLWAAHQAAIDSAGCSRSRPREQVSAWKKDGGLWPPTYYFRDGPD